MVFFNFFSVFIMIIVQQFEKLDLGKERFNFFREVVERRLFLCWFLFIKLSLFVIIIFVYGLIEMVVNFRIKFCMDMYFMYDIKEL